MLAPDRRSAVVQRAAPIVAARLCGGLGNQLFQFAAGYSLAQRCGARLVLDATPFTLPQERRNFALSPYPLDADVVFDGYAYPPTRPLIVLPRPSGLPARPDSLVDRIAYRLVRRRSLVDGAVIAAVRGLRRVAGRPPGLRVFTEKGFDYNSAFTSLGKYTYLDGYWQSPRYFDDVHDLVCRDLTLSHAPNAANTQWLARIHDSNSVCVHVRRGDYLLSDHFATHGVCSPVYYAHAMRVIAERMASPQFFVFSDDLAWSRAHIAGANVAFVDANPPDAAHDELRLMAACRHHVVANSSLSWWGAWLARHEGQIVIRPDPWFSVLKQTPDLFPTGWLALPRE